MARRRAVVMSQSPGLSGTPDSGHCASAATSASWARSSARPTSRTRRVSPAISRADSIRKTAAIARSVSAAMRQPTNASAVRVQGALLLGDLLANAVLLGAQLGRELLAEVLGLEDLADLDLRFARHGIGGALDPLDGFLERAHLEDPEARDQLLGLGERPVDHGALAAREAN